MGSFRKVFRIGVTDTEQLIVINDLTTTPIKLCKRAEYTWAGATKISLFNAQGYPTEDYFTRLPVGIKPEQSIVIELGRFFRNRPGADLRLESFMKNFEEFEIYSSEWRDGPWNYLGSVTEPIQEFDITPLTELKFIKISNKSANKTLTIRSVQRVFSLILDCSLRRP